MQNFGVCTVPFFQPPEFYLSRVAVLGVCAASHPVSRAAAIICSRWNIGAQDGQ